MDNTFQWDENTVKEFVLFYNNHSDWITGCDPIKKKMDEFKESKQPKKEPVPLFTTEDGVKIFEGGKWWIIDQEDGEIREVCVYQPNFDIKRFSTKEAAEEFCIMDKPVLSLQEITDVFKMANPSSHPHIFFNYVKNTITELVKSKLNG